MKMMQSLAFLHQKGGTGKTTLAIASCIALAASGARVLLLDIDPQGSASTWGDHYAERFVVVVRAQGPGPLRCHPGALQPYVRLVHPRLPAQPGRNDPADPESGGPAADPGAPGTTRHLGAGAYSGTARRCTEPGSGRSPIRWYSTQWRDEALEPLQAIINRLGLELADLPIRFDPGLALRCLRGRTCPESLNRQMMQLLTG